jgi:hypothetical protein
MKNNIFNFLILFTLSITLNAKIWRVNNNPLIDADALQLTPLFNGVNNVSDPEAANGDTIHLEPSATTYNAVNINKQVTIIGNGYFLSGSSGNMDLQENIHSSKIQNFIFGIGSAGSKFIGVEIIGVNSFNSGFSGIVNLSFEKCKISGGTLFDFLANKTYENIDIRKSYIGGNNVLTHVNFQPTDTINNFIVENCIIEGNAFYFKPIFGVNILVRNNVFKLNNGSSIEIDLNRAYFANNLILTEAPTQGTNSNIFNDCIIKNNIFTNNQTTGNNGLPLTIGALSTNGNNLINIAESTIIVNTGSVDGKFQLATGSPAINGGVDIGGNKPNCGAFGGNDPYKLSGIPGIPTIYSLAIPTSIPFGQATMNATISTRNNN